MRTAQDLLNEIDTDFASESDRGYYEEKIVEAMEKYAEQFKGCVCTPEETTGTTQVHCCNICGKPAEEFWK